MAHYYDPKDGDVISTFFKRGQTLAQLEAWEDGLFLGLVQKLKTLRIDKKQLFVGQKIVILLKILIKTYFFVQSFFNISYIIMY